MSLEGIFVVSLTSLLLIGTGWYWKEKPPKKINWWYGYRTRRSMANQQVWDYANKIGAKMMIAIGWQSLLLSLLGYFLFPNEAGIIASFFIVLMSIGGGMFWCETQLNKHFDKNGKPKG